MVVGFESSNRVFLSHFGVSKKTVAILFLHLINLQLEFQLELHHVFWTLYFLKVYNSLDVCCSYWNVDHKTFTLWIWRIIGLIVTTLDTVSILILY